MCGVVNKDKTEWKAHKKNHQENAEKVIPFKLLHMHLPPKYYIYKK